MVSSPDIKAAMPAGEKTVPKKQTEPLREHLTVRTVVRFSQGLGYQGFPGHM